MEALFILLAELIILPIALLVPLLVECIVAFGLALASFVEAVTGFSIGLTGLKRRRERSQGQPVEVKLPPERRVLLKRLSWTLGGVLVVTVAGVCLLNFVFFESSLRWGLGRIAKRSGIEIQFASASGNVFSGHLTLKGVTAQRDGDAVSNFNLRAEELAVELSVFKLFSRTAPVEKVHLSGLKGDFHRVKTPERLKLRKHYEVRHLRLENIDVAVRDSSRPKEARFVVKIDELDSQPLRSRFAVFDLLFRSNASGKIAGQPFAIRTRKTESGRETHWEANGLPVAFVAHHLGGPFDWLAGGTVDVRVEDKWSIAQNARIDMKWSFVLKQLSVNPPGDTSAPGRLLAAAVGKYLQEHAERLEVNFSFTLDERQFEGAASADAAGLGKAAREGFARELARLTGTDPDALDERIQTGIEAFKQHLDNRRKKSSGGIENQ